MKKNRTVLCLAVVALWGCDPDSGTKGTGTAGPGPAPGASETGEDRSPPATSGSPSDNESTSGAPSDDGSTSSDFIAEPDMGPTIECDVWEQDCPNEEKCVPWANDGGITWNATRCVPVMDNPGQPGDTCVAESGLSGIDDCGDGAMCWNIDGETGEGNCVAFCTGSPEAPQCDDAATECSISLDGVLILCLPSCDPLLQDCPNEIEACYPGVESGFQCYPDYSGEGGAYGDPCEYTNVCNPGLFCGAAALVPGCENGLCCSEFCDITEEDPSSQCAGQAQGQECFAWYAEGEAPPGHESIGYCALPA